MPDSKENLIEAATRPFSDNAEMKLAAVRLLEESVKPDAAGAENAIARWEAVDGKPQGNIRRFAFFGLVALVSAFVGIAVTRDTIKHAQWTWASAVKHPPPFSRSLDHIFEDLSKLDKLLLAPRDLGHAAYPLKEALWRIEPESPAYFAEYARFFINENGQLPPDYFEIARRLDPGNSWFTYLAANLEAKEVAIQNPDQSWTIKDPARMDRVLSLVKKARDQPGYDSFDAEMWGRRLGVLPQRNLPQFFETRMVVAYSQLTYSSDLDQLPAAISARSSTAAEKGDVKAFQEISEDGEKLLCGLLDNPVKGMIVIEILNGGTAVSMSTRFAADAKKLGLSKESERWTRITARLAEKIKGRSSRKFILDGRPANPAEFGSLAMEDARAAGSKAAQSPPPLAKADLKPGRMLDHAILSRFCAYATWIVMALCLGATALYRFRVAAMPRRLARRAVDLLDRRDWAWIVGAGVILPFVYVMAINHLTPLGGHGSGLRGTAMLLPTAHFLGLWLLWFTVPAQIVRWRLARRVDVMGFPKATWLGWVTVASAVAFVPLIGLAAISHSFGGVWTEWMTDLEIEIVKSSISPVLFWTAVGLMALPLAGTAARVCVAIFSRPGGLIPRTASSMALTQVYAGTLLLAALSIPAFKTSGQYWFDRDRLMRADPSMPGWSAYEYQVAVQARKELREAMGDESATLEK